MISGIYEIINVQNNCKYIGSSNNIYTRWSHHISDLNRNKHCNLHLQRAWNKYGKKTFIFNILFLCEENKLLQEEQRFLDTLNPEYNMCPTAGSCLGRGSVSEETKRKIGLANSKKKRTEKEKQRLREINLGKKQSQETKDKRSMTMKGRIRPPFSADWKRKMSLKKKKN